MQRTIGAVTEDDELLADYLIRVRKAARRLPRDRRDWVITQVGDRLADALGADDDGTPDAQADVGAAVARLGEPKDVVLAVDGHVPGTEASWLEYAAVLLVLAGGVLWQAAWLAGLTLLRVSPRWRWPDKLLATLVWPGGLIAANLLAGRYSVTSLVAPGGPGFFRPRASTIHYLLNSTLGHPPLRHLLVLLLAAVPPVLVAVRLLRRARRPDSPQTAAKAAALPGCCHRLRRQSARRRDKSEVNTPAGSTVARSRRKSSSRGYILGISSAGIRESLAR